MTLFTKIINGEIPCYKIAEDENYFAFLDIRPLHAGHTFLQALQRIHLLSSLWKKAN
mgnify:CR=1 FL=1